MAKHRAPAPPRLRRAVIAATGAVLIAGLGAGPAFADPAPPTNGGNGAGQSGQCTGPAAERPTACQSPGGVSAQ